jgi:hypothetical protein
LKIAFDEHVPVGLVRVFKTLAGERKFRNSVGVTGRGPADVAFVVAARDYAPLSSDADFVSGSDVPWLERFKADGGTAIISGNTKMLEVPHELLAIQRLGLVAIFFDPKWNGWDFFQKSSLLLWHWNALVTAVRSAKPATLFQIPLNWKSRAVLKRLKSPDTNICHASTKARERKTAAPKPSSKSKGTKRSRPAVEGLQDSLPLEVAPKRNARAG